MIKIVLRIVGTISLFLGILGIALPVLPTTPFLLLSAYCYLKSAPAWHKRLLESKHLGPYIKNFQENILIAIMAKQKRGLLLQNAQAQNFTLVLRIKLPRNNFPLLKKEVKLKRT